MEHRFRKRVVRAASIGVAGLVLVACNWTSTGSPARVADTSAELHATINTDQPGATVTWWFEYGPTSALGTATPQRTMTFPAGSTSPRPVSEWVTGLAHGTTYHFRSCVQNGSGSSGSNLCGMVRTFTTTNGRDSVHGLGVSFQDLETGFTIGVEVDATSNANGSSPTGEASRSPGVYYPNVWDAGPATCLRGEGNQATVGFTADYSMFGLPAVHAVIYVEDNGATGDRFAVDLVSSPTTSCPDPDDLQDATWQTIVRGNLVVHDHP